MGYIGYVECAYDYILCIFFEKKLLNIVRLVLDKPSDVNYTEYMMRIKDGWSTVKFPKWGVEVRVSHPNFHNGVTEIIMPG